MVVATLHDGARIEGEFLEIFLENGLRLRTGSGALRVPLARLSRFERNA
jgi:hypothetical protein